MIADDLRLCMSKVQETSKHRRESLMPLESTIGSSREHETAKDVANDVEAREKKGRHFIRR